MIHRIHILGASGAGTTTLGRALAARLQVLTSIQTITSGYRLTHHLPTSENVPSVNDS
jgi:adenylate kinase family enzyme